MTESFYHTIASLQERESGYRQAVRPASDLNSWIFEHLAVDATANILDIGTGSGKRAMRLAQLVRDPGYVLSIDRSYEALRSLSQQSLDTGLEKRIRLLQVALDELDGHLRRNDFDCAVSSRLLAQMRHPRTLFHTLALALRSGGIFFFYGPSSKNNAELKRFSAEVQGTFGTGESREPTFMEGVGLKAARDFFSQVTVVKFEQTVRLDSPEKLYTCWNASSLYNEALDKTFRLAALRHFEQHAAFETTQRIIGIKAVK